MTPWLRPPDISLLDLGGYHGRIGDPKCASYAKLAAAEKKPVYALAVRDFFRPPSVDELDLTRYAGRRGDQIGLFATDDSGVFRVEITIRDMTNAIVEHGDAYLDRTD